MKPPKAVSDYMAKLGKKGGEATGDSKVRGSAEYYKRISEKAVKARKAKRKLSKQKSGNQ